jgi:pyruvate ferredoxin oxidoreductase delta subunit
MSSLPGWKALPPGCPVQAPLSAANNHTGSWRSERPLWNHEQCVQCGVCDMFCPEACITQNSEGFYEANLDYCKGCGICKQECPTQCISMKQEEE